MILGGYVGWVVELLPNRGGPTTKAQFNMLREQKVAEYELSLTPYKLNGLTYVDGEQSDYSSRCRVMNELASFIHKVDVGYARGW